MGRRPARARPPTPGSAYSPLPLPTQHRQTTGPAWASHIGRRMPATGLCGLLRSPSGKQTRKSRQSKPSSAFLGARKQGGQRRAGATWTTRAAPARERAAAAAGPTVAIGDRRARRAGRGPCGAWRPRARRRASAAPARPRARPGTGRPGAARRAPGPLALGAPAPCLAITLPPRQLPITPLHRRMAFARKRPRACAAWAPTAASATAGSRRMLVGPHSTRAAVL